MVYQVPFANLLLQHNQIQKELEDVIFQIIQESTFINGKHIGEFEHLFSVLNNSAHCISCANGTDALYIALRSLNIKPGDEVITTSHSWISTSEAITQAGGKVIFCDTDVDTFCIDVSKIRGLITEKTVGILPVHLYGHPADMASIMKLADEFNLWVVEDCAQAHLSTFANKIVGNFGHIATFSFYPGKNLGAIGDAGAIVTNDCELADWCRLFARHGGKGIHHMEGINSRMDTIQAAVLSLKIPLLEKWTQERISIAHQYNNRLLNLDSVKTPVVKKDVKHVYHLYTIKVNQRDKLREYLNTQGIQTNINYPIALPFLPAYSHFNHKSTDFPATFYNQSSILSLPVFPGMTENQISYVCDNILSFYT